MAVASPQTTLFAFVMMVMLVMLVNSRNKKKKLFQKNIEKIMNVSIVALAFWRHRMRVLNVCVLMPASVARQLTDKRPSVIAKRRRVATAPGVNSSKAKSRSLSTVCRVTSVPTITTATKWSSCACANLACSRSATHVWRRATCLKTTSTPLPTPPVSACLRRSLSHSACSLVNKRWFLKLLFTWLFSACAQPAKTN